MTLLALLIEIIQLIGDRLDDAELNALTQANSHMHKLLNERLYHRDVIKPHSRSLYWATGRTPSNEATARKDNEATARNTVLCAIEAGRHLKQVLDNFHTALAQAAARGYAHIVEARWHQPKLLCLAVVYGNRAIVKMLLAAVNIDPNVRDHQSLTPLQGACHSYPLGSPPDPDIVKLFLAHPDVDINLQAPGGDTALMYAVRSLGYYNTKYINIIKFLLDQKDIDVNLRDNKGRTALSIAALPNFLAGANLLLKREDVKVDLPDNDRQTPLFIACAIGNHLVVDLLLKQKGVNPNAKDNRGCTPLANVCGLDWPNRIEEVVKLLLSHPDTDPCAVDNDGASILDKSSGNKSLPDYTRNTILGLLQAHPKYQHEVIGRIAQIEGIADSAYKNALVEFEEGDSELSSCRCFYVAFWGDLLESGRDYVIFGTGRLTGNEDCTQPKYRRWQLPVINTFGLTIHKVQGLSLPSFTLALNKSIFSDGQAYVGLSRATTSERLFLTQLDLRLLPRLANYPWQLPGRPRPLVILIQY
ncbi:Ankyrin repeat-containing domain protein [Elaphomyces granulatus]